MPGSDSQCASEGGKKSVYCSEEAIPGQKAVTASAGLPSSGVFSNILIGSNSRY